MSLLPETVWERRLMGYGKFFSSTFTGSMYGASTDVFAVWGYIIANTVDSTVELNPKSLANIFSATEQRMQIAIDYLCEPDPRSRISDNEGRRLIREGEYQYHVVTHQHYRAIRNEDDRREYNRLKMQESRARRSKKIDEITKDKEKSDKPKKKADPVPSKPVTDDCQSQSMTVIDNQSQLPMSIVCAQPEAETEAYTETHAPTGRPEPVKPYQSITVIDGQSLSITVIDGQSLSITVIDMVLEALASLDGTRQDAQQIMKDCREAKRKGGGQELEIEEVLYLVEKYVAHARDPKQGIQKPMGYVITMVPRAIGGRGYLFAKEANRRAQEQRDMQGDQERIEADWRDRSPIAQVLADTIWHGVLNELRKIIIRQSFETWIKPTQACDVLDQILYIRVPSPEFRQIGEMFSEQIQAVVSALRPRIESVRFVVTATEVP
jgi:hypothetical protein